MSDWTRHLKILVGTLAALIAVAVAVIFTANPYGNLRLSPMRHVLMDDNQRFQYPAVIRSGRYDSLVIGTSTSRLLKPSELEAHFGGRFANLALNSGMPWEQWQIARLFAREVAKPRTLVIGLDHVWCAHDADTRRITIRGFPEWMFDASPWNDPLYMLNVRALEISGRRIWHALGRVKERWPHDGYEVFVPPERDYDLTRARAHIHAVIAPPEVTERAVPPELLPPYDFPALAWLEDIFASRRFERVVLLLTPIHMAALPRAGSRAHAREQACKAAMAAIAKRHGALIVDFRIPSPITREDSHYWDPLHYRVTIATRIVDDLGKALATGADDPGGDWQVLGKKP